MNEYTHLPYYPAIAHDFFIRKQFRNIISLPKTSIDHLFDKKLANEKLILDVSDTFQPRAFYPHLFIAP